MVTYDSVSADLSSQVLDTIPGSIEEKLLFLQDQLGENFPNIVIQYVCGDDTSLVQIKGQWHDVSNIHSLLAKWIESINESLMKDALIIKNDSPKESDISLDKQQGSLQKLQKLRMESVKKALSTMKQEQIDSIDEKHSNLCEFCGEACPKFTPETNEQAVQTDIPLEVKIHHPQPLSTGKKTRLGKHSNDEKRTTSICDEEYKQSVLQHSPAVRTSSGRVVKPTFKTKEDNELLNINKKVLDNIKGIDTGLGNYVVVTPEDNAEDLKDKRDGTGNGPDAEPFINEGKETLNILNRIDKIDDAGQADDSEDNYIVLNDIPDIMVEVNKDGQVNISTESIIETEDTTVPQMIEPVAPIITHSARGRKRKIDLFGEGKMISESKVRDVISEIMAKLGGDAMEGKVDIPCALCDYKTNAKRHLRAHMLRCHVKQKKKCYICGKTYSLPKDLRFHLKSHYPEHNCLKCNRKFPSKSILSQHVERYHNEEKERKRALKGMMQKCEYCDYTNNQYKNIKDHVARHHQEKGFACQKCPKKFALKKDLVTHEKAHNAKFKCEECNKILKSKIALKTHVNAIHLGIKSVYRKEHMCDHCGFICRSKTHYSEHVNKEHLHVKPFGCPLCKMAFYTNASLRSHLLTHTDTKKFECTVCEKQFKHKTSLKMHEMTHREYSNRPFECMVCRKGFSQKGALIRHTRIHTGEKPYKCRLCDAAFSDYSILRRHMLGVHKINSKNMCQRKDITGNRGGPKPEKAIVDDIDQYKNLVRTPEEQEEEIQEDENLLAVVTNSALQAQTDFKNKQPRFQPIRPRTEVIDPSGNTIQVEINHGTEMDDLKGIQPMNIIPVSSIDGGTTIGSESIYINPVSGATTLGEVTNITSGASDIHEYFVAEVNPQMSQELTNLGAGYTVLQAGTAGLGSVSNVVSDFVGSGMANLPFTVQTIPSQDGEPIAIQIIQSGVQQ